jgi:hypothetical protein
MGFFRNREDTRRLCRLAFDSGLQQGRFRVPVDATGRWPLQSEDLFDEGCQSHAGMRGPDLRLPRASNLCPTERKSDGRAFLYTAWQISPPLTQTSHSSEVASNVSRLTCEARLEVKGNSHLRKEGCGRDASIRKKKREQLRSSRSDG